MFLRADPCTFLMAPRQQVVRAWRERRRGVAAGLRGGLPFLVVFALLLPAPAWAQAAPLFVTVHVDAQAPNASDANDGSLSAPLRTILEGINRAMGLRNQGRATRVLVHPGTYREALVGPVTARSGAPIVIEAAVSGEAIVSGSDVWTGWDCEGRVCTHSWPFDWGSASIPWPGIEVGPLGLRREMVFVDGELMAQKLELEEALATEGTFHVDEEAAVLTVHVPGAIDPAAAVFEVSVRDVLLAMQGLYDLTIRGLVFQHGNPALPMTAVNIVDQGNVVVEQVVVRWNNWTGIWFRGEDLVLRDSLVNHNGGTGIGAYQTTRLTLERNESTYNNWRGFSGGLIGWAVGDKFLFSRDLVIRDHVAVHNLARGLWIDYDNANVTIERLRSCYNANDGLFVEQSQGPVVVKDSSLCHNARAGLRTSASNRLELRGNVIEGNADAQIAISGDLDREVRDWVDGRRHVLDNRAWIFAGNVLRGTGDALLYSTSLPQTHWFDLMASARFEDNRYLHERTDVFMVPGGQRVDFEGWRRESLQDASSSFALE